MASARPEDGADRARVLTGVLFFGLLCGAGAFLWTIENAPPPPSHSARDLFGRDLVWSNRARGMLARRQHHALVESARDRINDWPGDEEAWLFGGFALEELAAAPGLPALEHRARADAVWEELLRRVEPWRDHLDADGLIDWEGVARAEADSRPLDNPAYFAGWALMGLGQPVWARERFTHHEATYPDRGSPGMRAYNRACYQALAGDSRGALESWRESRERGLGTSMLWAVSDPDLELIHPDLLAGDLAFRIWTIYRDHRYTGDEPTEERPDEQRRGPRDG